MVRLALAVLLSSVALNGVYAADTCKAQADAKKLAGAALTSFMKKCENDAKATCDKQAADPFDSFFSPDTMNFAIIPAIRPIRMTQRKCIARTS